MTVAILAFDGVQLLDVAGPAEVLTTANAYGAAYDVRAYPKVTVDSDPVFARDGAVVTSAGVTAGIDLALALVEEDHGAGLAREVARHLVVFMARPAGQSQFSARLSVREAKHPVLRAAMDAVTTDPAADHATERLASRAGVSPRHLTRLFRTHTGQSPGQYVESIRVEAAQALLEGGLDSVESVAATAGFGSAETMRRVFHQHLGVSPSTFRARFRSTLSGSSDSG
jgi:transcriptional regulator GlxA family with amidase domain